MQDVCTTIEILNCHPSIDSSYRLLLLCVLRFSVRDANPPSALNPPLSVIVDRPIVVMLYCELTAYEWFLENFIVFREWNLFYNGKGVPYHGV